MMGDLWKERLHVADVKQIDGRLWLQVDGCNAPVGTLPTTCFSPGQGILVTVVFDPTGVHPSQEIEDAPE